MILDFGFWILGFRNRISDWRRRVGGVVAYILLAALAHAGDPGLSGDARASSDKWDYNLFNPVPRELMREMATDRPDKTESPYSVDAGHYQLEMSFVDTSADLFNVEQSGRDVEAFSYAPMNLKAGLLNNVDLQVVVIPHVAERAREKTDDDGNGVQEEVVHKQSGFGDMQTRVKINLWGNDGGATAFAAMPFVKIPTAEGEIGNGFVEGGLILPLAVELPAGWGMGIMAQYDFIRDGDGAGHHAECVHTITFSHAIVGDLSGYAEFFSNVSTEEGSELAATVDFGLTYALTEDIQFDAGVNVGITRAADELNPFCGVSMRY